jgi:hypothetical protein
MTVSSATQKVQYNGNGSTTVFAYTFKVFNQNDLTVIVRSAAGTETVKTITTHYTVSGVGSAGGGNVTMLTAPASGETLTVLREQDLVQELDLVENDPFPAQSLEDALDKLTFTVQQQGEQIDRSIKASRTNTITSTEFTVSAATRANKIFAFDSAGELAVTQELGTYRGNWATATAFKQRDIVKDTSNNNIYICVTAHTSTGSQPISSNADVAKWALIVDAASATTSASAAASSASAASTSATNASNSATAAAGSASAASSSASAASGSETNAASSAASAAASYDSFDDRYLGPKSSNPTLDNDGNALLTGALYFNTVSNEMRVYTGSAWVAAYASLGSALLSVNNLSDLSNKGAGFANLMGYTSTATAGATTTLTNTSTQYQLFTGTLAQTVMLPVTSTLAQGWTFHIVNNSTGNLTVNSSGGNLVATVIPQTTAMVTCIGITLTTAADWEAGFTDFGSITGTGANVLAVSPTLTGTTSIETLTATGAVSDLIGNIRDLVNSSKTAAYVPAATDNGKLINITTGGITINASVFSAGQNVTIYNNSASSQTITQGTSVTMYLAGTATTGNRTLAQRGIATILCVASNTFVCSGAGVT